MSCAQSIDSKAGWQGLGFAVTLSYAYDADLRLVPAQDGKYQKRDQHDGYGCVDDRDEGAPNLGR